MPKVILVAFLLFGAAQTLLGTTYEVRPGTPLDTISEVPWATLQPGDTVLIYWRSTPYKEKWVICRQGTSAAPITVRGVLGPNGERPVIDGNGAVTAPGLNFWSENRGTIKIGGANVPADTMPKYITIENLEIRGAHPSYQFTDDSGQTQTYSTSASPIFVEKGENLVFRNNVITDGANGFFVASSDDEVSRNILVEGNYIYGNGVSGSNFQHNNYTAAIGITFQYNRFGPLRSGAPGVNLKDRSAGLVVRYNWIEGGNRNLDLVDGEDSSQIRSAPEYRKTFVYGNVLIKQDGGNNQAIHYGGDSGETANYRKGKLYLYNNTVYSTRSGTTVVMRLSTNDESCDARNNIFYNTAVGTNLAMLEVSGVLTMANNWAKTGWRNSHEGGGFEGTVTGGGTTITGTSPAFVDAGSQDFHLSASSTAINAGTALHPDTSPGNELLREYVKHQTSQPRPVSGILDIGAFEYSAVAPVQITTLALPNTVRFRWYGNTPAASGGSGSYVWSVTNGKLPPGMSLDAATGRIHGWARLKGSWTFTLNAEDAALPGSSASRTFTIESHLHY